MAYFVLTFYLLSRLLASAPARIVNTASDAHESASLDFDDLQSHKAYGRSFLELLRDGGPGYKVYGRSKLCNVLFTRELAKRTRIAKPVRFQAVISLLLSSVA
jgi:NAD(P)-dependent dehydrogenase (short-subunit alcohol dehydrogenase family)